MDTRAIFLVTEYVKEHLDKSDAPPNFDVLTYNGDLNEWYLDAYRKFENKVIKDLEG